MVKRVLFLILLSLLSLPGFSQQYLSLKTYNVDSLHRIFQAQSGKEKVNSLNMLAASLFFKNTDLSESYAREALALAQNLDYDEGIASAYQNFGHIYFYRSHFPEALNHYLESLEIFKDLGMRYMEAQAYYDIAVLHNYSGNYEMTFDYADISLNILRECQKSGEAIISARDTLKILGGLALIYDEIGMDDKSLRIFQDYLDIARQNNFSETEKMLLTFMIATSFLDLNQTDSARVYFDKAMAFPDLNPHIEALKFRVISWQARLNRREGNFDLAISKFKKAFEYYDKKGFLFWAWDASQTLGNYHYNNNNLEAAETYFRKSEKNFDEMLAKNSWERHDSLKNIISYGLEMFLPLPPKLKKEFIWEAGYALYWFMFKLHEAKGMHEEALYYHVAFTKANDTLHRLKSTRETMELQLRYETRTKEDEIEFLAKENEFKAYKLNQTRLILFGLAGLFILIIILAFVLVRQNKLKEQQKNLVLQQKLFRSQMNPHFLFNSLSSIHNFMIHEKPAEAATYLHRFSKLIRAILNSSVEEHILLSEETNTIENYLELQKVRFPEKFDFSIEVDDTIDPDSTYIPAMLTQPFIENAIEHGIRHKESRGNIDVRFSKKGDLIIFEVEDDGIGRERSKELQPDEKKDHKSLATYITRERIRVLNRTLKKNIKLEIIDLKDENGEAAGTRVVLSIPLG